jgi:protease II
MARLPSQGQIRTLHGITWTDDLAWMESMDSTRWKSCVKEEQIRWAAATKNLDTTVLEAELHEEPVFAFTSDTIQVAAKNTLSYEWRWSSNSKGSEASDIYSAGDYVWAVHDTSSGAENYAISCYKRDSDNILWSHKGVGPFVALVGGRCYCLEAKKTLVYYRLVSWNCVTGGDRRVHYEEDDYRYNLEIRRTHSEDAAFLLRQAGSKQDLFEIRKGGLVLLEGISLDSSRFITSGPGEYLCWTTGRWSASPDIGVQLPSFEKEVPEKLDTMRGLCITHWKGCRTLWSIKKRATPKVLWKGYGSITIDPWNGTTIRIVQPGCPTVWWNLFDPVPVASDIPLKYAISNDGTEVPFLIVRGSAASSSNLLVVGYGAYGIPMSMSTSRWEPLIKRGFTVVIGLWRGGGDHTPEWEDEGRLQGRVKVLEDAESVVREASSVTGCSPSNIVVYGRSAGGLWVGGLSAKYPNGSLFGTAYMEVPYLDVLRTVTNRSLPLTEIEADEFGLPSLRLSDFASVLQWSPMENLPAGGTPGITQIVRTGINDSEVLAYESMKWITRCRAGRHSTNILLAIEDDQGHFVNGSISSRQRAQDLALLLQERR